MLLSCFGLNPGRVHYLFPGGTTRTYCGAYCTYGKRCVTPKLRCDAPTMTRGNEAGRLSIISALTAESPFISVTAI